MRGQLRGQPDGCRTVRAADDGDGGRFLFGEGQRCNAGQAEGARAEVCRKNTELRRRTQQEGARIGQQRAKVGHAADSKEDQRRINAELDALIQIPHQAACLKVLPEILPLLIDVYRVGLIHNPGMKMGELFRCERNQ